MLSLAGTDVDTLGETGLLRACLTSMRPLHWQRLASLRGLKRDTADQWNAVAVATLLTAEGDEEALAVARLIPHFADETQLELITVARWLGDLYPAATTASKDLRIAPLEPDRLGEVLVADVLSRFPDLLPAALDAASDRQLVHALTVATRAAFDDPAVKDQLRQALDDRLAHLLPARPGCQQYPAGDAINPELFNAVVVAMLVSEASAGAIALDQALTL